MRATGVAAAAGAAAAGVDEVRIDSTGCAAPLLKRSETIKVRCVAVRMCVCVSLMSLPPHAESEP